MKWKARSLSTERERKGDSVPYAGKSLLSENHVSHEYMLMKREHYLHCSEFAVGYDTYHHVEASGKRHKHMN